MSKRLKNYPDPIYMVDTYSADAVKLYLLNSPIVKGESLKFSELGVKHVVRDVFLPWFNAYRFLIENVKRYEAKSNTNFVFDPALRHQATNLLDKWIIAANQSLLKFFREELDNYKLYTIIGQLVNFLIDLNKWYIKLNRTRMKGSSGPDEAKMSLNTLFDVLFSTTLMMSCFTPFISEYLYLNLKNGFEDGHELKKDSIHFLRIPEADLSLIDDSIVHKVNHMKKIVEMTRSVRDHWNIPIKKPLRSAILVNSNPDFHEAMEIFGDYIKEEINAYELQIETDEDKFVTYSCDYNQMALGKRLKKQFTKAIKDKISELKSEEIKEYMATKKLLVEGVEIIEGDLIPTKQLKDEYKNHDNFAGNSAGEYCVVIDKTSDEQIEMSYHSREFLGRIQKLRKEAGLKLDADVEIFYKADTEFLKKSLVHHMDEIKKTVMKPLISANYKPSFYPEIATADFKLGKETGKIWICKPSITFHTQILTEKYSDKAFIEGIEKLVETLGLEYVKSQADANAGVLKTKLDGKDIELTLGTDFFLDGFKTMNFS
jgi:isoleucyl-tRNA synthetase